MRNPIIDHYFQTELQKCADDEIIRKQISQNRYSKEHTLATFFKSQDIDMTPHPISANFNGYFHTHNYFEFIYVYKGQAIEHFTTGEQIIREGQFVLLNTDTRHGTSIESEDTWLVNIQITKNLFNQSFFSLLSSNDLLSSFFIESLYYQTEREQYIIFDPNDLSKAELLIQSLMVEYISHPACYQSAMQSYLSLTFTELLRAHIYHIEEITKTDETFTTILSYINEHIADVTLNSVAEHFHYNTNYLSRLFKKYTNKSFSGIVNELRLNTAASYLKNTTLSVDTISEMIGCYDRSYFNKIFKKKFGVTPGDYRLSHRPGF